MLSVLDDVPGALGAYGLRRLADAYADSAVEVRRASDGAELVKIDTLGVWVDLASGRPIRIPPELLTDFAPNIVQDSQPSGRPESSD